MIYVYLSKTANLCRFTQILTAQTRRIQLTNPEERSSAPIPDRPKPRKLGSSRVPEGSVFYTRLLPALIVVLGVFTVLLIIFAIGVFLLSLS